MSDLALYEIDTQIAEVLEYIVNEETGEIDPIAETELDQLKKDRELKIGNIGLHIKNQVAFIDAIKDEEKKLRERRKIMEKKIEWLKNYLEMHLDGEKLELPNLKIGWRKSESLIEKGNFDVEKFAQQYPELVKIVYQPDKNSIKKFIKEKGVGIEGFEIISKNNIQIK